MNNSFESGWREAVESQTSDNDAQNATSNEAANRAHSSVASGKHMEKRTLGLENGER
jgi:hypothetical protein